jgi:hypothetical protein
MQTLFQVFRRILIGPKLMFGALKKRLDGPVYDVFIDACEVEDLMNSGLKIGAL